MKDKEADPPGTRLTRADAERRRTALVDLFRIKPFERTILRLVVGSLALLGIFSSVSTVVQWATPALVVRLDPALSGEQVEVRADPYNLPEPRQFVGDQSNMRVSPISHGYYAVGVWFVGGAQLWVRFLHADVGNRRRVELRFSRSAVPGCVNIRLTADGWLPPRRTVLFEGDVRPADTGERSPLELSGP